MSLASAQVHLEAATVIDILQPSVRTNTKNINPRAPPGAPMTTLKMYGRACAPGAPITSSRGGIVTQMGMMKKRPAIPPTGTQRLIAFGTFTGASWHSSAILEIMPMAEKQYAAGRRPMKKVKPPQPEKEVS